MKVLELVGEQGIEQFCAAGGRQLSPAQCLREQADLQLMAVDAQGRAAARCSLWWRCVPALPGERPGLIGHYAADSDAAAADLLEQALAILGQNDCTCAIGPMDGSTFRSYRLVTECAVDGLARPPFFLEPRNPTGWVTHFADAGFTPIAHYVSSIAPLGEDARLPLLRAQVAHAGIVVRQVDLTHFESELRSIYQVVTASFRQNFLYSPVDEHEFLAQYTAARAFIRPELVWLAERDGVAAGFLFAYPDLAQAQRGEPVDTVVLKTLAVTPNAGGIGLGGRLTAEVQQAALQLGYTQAIHALMIEDNRSRRISAHYGHVMRSYALYGKAIAG